MAVSDLTLVRYLVQATLDEERPIHWRQSDGAGFRAEHNGVKLTLFHMHLPGGPALGLRLSEAHRGILIEEPFNEAHSGQRYHSEEDRHLAESLQLLAECVARQCAKSAPIRRDLTGPMRESLVRRVLQGRA